jgi:hypothetical protein
MSNKERGIKRHRRNIFCQSFFPTAFVLIFVMTFWLWIPISAHAAGAVSFDGDDDFLVFSFNEPQTFEALTLMVWWQPGTFNPYKEADSAQIRATNQYPPKGGYIKTSDSKFSLRPNKFNSRQIGFQISTDDGDWEIWSDELLPENPELWHHLAVTYDGSQVVIYLNGDDIKIQEDVTGNISNVLSIWFARLVHAIPGALGGPVGYNVALPKTDIQSSMDCGPVSGGRIFYWPLNEGSGNAVTDPESGLTLYFGDAGDNTKYEPVWIEADYLLDTDGDNVADSCDNCPGIPNDQADQDGDGAGDLCDYCSNDGPMGAGGGECNWTEEGVVDEVMALAPTIRFRWGTGPDEYSAPDAFMVPQDCDNTRLVCFDLEGKPLPSKCQRPSSYVLTVGEFCYDDNGQIKSSCEENEVPVSGEPGGDLELYTDGMETTITCDLLDTYDFSAFANGARCYAVHISSTHDRDRNWDSGSCSQPPCVEPDQDFPFGYEWIGRATSETFDIEPTIVVPINVKVTSFPNSINLNGGGEITLGIYSTADFDATKIKPDTVVLKKSRLDPNNSYCAELNKTATRDLTETLCGGSGDIGACNNADGVARDDMLLHLDVPCLPFTEADIGEWEVVVTGNAEDSVGNTINFIGTDKLVVR